MRTPQHVDIQSDTNRFYGLIDELEKGLGGKRRFEFCSMEQIWPQRGVYFLFEDGEFRQGSTDKQRVTRVGTMAIHDPNPDKRPSDRTLWQRLKDHKGSSSGCGNHAHSALRRHVGSALINRAGGNISVPTWGVRGPRTAIEEGSVLALEAQATEYIGKMQLLWLSVNDLPSSKSDRRYIEKYAVALLSRTNEASSDWLGNYAKNLNVRESGLWCDEDVNGPLHTCFLDVLEKYVEKTVDMGDTSASFAPKDWWRGVGEY